MANLTPEQAAPILKYTETIKKEDLAPEGIETEPHITALYGLLSDDPRPVIKACKAFGPITATLGPVEVFQNPEYDVLKVTVASPALVRLNATLRKLPYSNDHPEYHPHLTLAYLKPGASEEYVGGDMFKDITLTFDTLVFSDAEKKKTEILLGKK